MDYRDEADLDESVFQLQAARQLERGRSEGRHWSLRSLGRRSVCVRATSAGISSRQRAIVQKKKWAFVAFKVRVEKKDQTPLNFGSLKANKGPAHHPQRAIISYHH